MVDKIDESMLELIERRLGDRVAERVRGSLFKLYALLGSVAIGALGYAGVDFVRGAREQAVRAAAAQTTAAVKEISDQARESIDKVRINTAVAEQLQEQARRVLSRIDEQLAALTPKIQLLEQVSGQIDALEAKRKSLESQIASNTEAARAGAETTSKVAELARQVEELSKLMRGLSQPAAPAGSPTVASSGAAQAATIQSNAEQLYQSANSSAIEQRRILDQPQTTVFLQFAGMTRADAEALAETLRGRGFNMPGIDEEAARANGLREIRYYWPADAEPARRLAAETRLGLAAIRRGEDREIAVRDYTAWPRAKPRPGIIELWLGLGSGR